MLNTIDLPPALALYLEHHNSGNSPFALIATDTPNSPVEPPSAALFEHSRHPREARAGLCLYLGFGLLSHEISQDCHTPAGSYWHGIYHRMEPDAWNAKYWFRQTGVSALFPQRNWDAAAFVDQVNQAIQSGDPARVHHCEELQLLEWQHLFHHCAKTPTSSGASHA